MVLQIAPPALLIRLSVHFYKQKPPLGALHWIQDPHKYKSLQPFWVPKKSLAGVLPD
jgi:hypothetical protein